MFILFVNNFIKYESDLRILVHDNGDKI